MYKKLLLKNLFQKRNLCVKSMIRTAIGAVEQEKVINCSKDGARQIMSIV